MGGADGDRLRQDEPVDRAGQALPAFDGPLYGDELDRLGLAGDEEPGSRPASAYLELHIEQGPKLERAGVPLGIVQGIRGIRQLPIEVSGHEAHSGSPMEGRDDALRKAARIVEALAELAESDPSEPSIQHGITFGQNRIIICAAEVMDHSRLQSSRGCSAVGKIPFPCPAGSRVFVPVISCG